MTNINVEIAENMSIMDGVKRIVIGWKTINSDEDVNRVHIEKCLFEHDLSPNATVLEIYYDTTTEESFAECVKIMEKVTILPYHTKHVHHACVEVWFPGGSSRFELNLVMEVDHA